MKVSNTLNTFKSVNKVNKKIVVPRHCQDRNGKSQQSGLTAEQDFYVTCQKHHYQWKNASKKQNCIDHIDCFITQANHTFSVDVKAAKKIARWNKKPQDKLLWVEWTARNGAPGWVRSKVDLIAFQMLNKQFLMVKTSELRDYVAPLIEKNKAIVRVDSQKDAVNGILWRRHGNKDEMTLLPSEDVALLPSSFFLG
jgi:hypothetical protein